MRRLLAKKVLLGALLGLLAAGMFAPTASARIIRGPRLGYFLFGVNRQGNRSGNNGRVGTAKFYKFTRLNIVLGVGKGRVTNRSGHYQIFRNAGNAVVDPQTGTIFPSTGDLQIVSRRRGRGRARTKLLLSYNPRRGFNT